MNQCAPLSKAIVIILFFLRHALIVPFSEHLSTCNLKAKRIFLTIFGTGGRAIPKRIVQKSPF
jgi:hypothetical protein